MSKHDKFRIFYLQESVKEYVFDKIYKNELNEKNGENDNGVNKIIAIMYKKVIN